ncbi:MAG: hypothetical protein ABIF12_03925 [bacterium]
MKKIILTLVISSFLTTYNTNANNMFAEKASQAKEQLKKAYNKTKASISENKKTAAGILTATVLASSGFGYYAINKKANTNSSKSLNEDISNKKLEETIASEIIKKAIVNEIAEEIDPTISNELKESIEAAAVIEEIDPTNFSRLLDELPVLTKNDIKMLKANGINTEDDLIVSIKSGEFDRIFEDYRYKRTFTNRVKESLDRDQK